VFTELSDHLESERHPRSRETLRRIVPPGAGDDNRHLFRYRNSIELAWLILEHQLVDRPLTEGDVTSFAFLMDMNVIFERYLTEWLRSRLRARGLRVDAQTSRLALRDVATRRPIGAIRPDILISTAGARPLPIDAKYKRYAGPNEDRRPRPLMSDLTQALLYAQVYGGPIVPRRTLLVFPTETSVPVSRSLELRDESVTGKRCTVDVRPFPLLRALREEPDPLLDQLVQCAIEPFVTNESGTAA